MAGLFKEIREFFWPVLEGDASSPKELETKEIICSNKELDDLIRIAKDYEASENERRKEIESKASVFIGTFAVATTIILSLAKDFLKQNTPRYFYLNVILIVAIILYLSMAIIYSVKCLSRRNFYMLGFPMYLVSDIDKNQKKKLVLLNLVNDVKKNQNVINDKLDYMGMAQEYFKRAVISVVILTILLTVEAIADSVAKQKALISVSMLKDIVFCVLIILLFACEIMINKKVDNYHMSDKRQ